MGTARLKCLACRETSCTESFSTAMHSENVFLMFEHVYKFHRPIFNYFEKDFAKWYSEETVSFFVYGCVHIGLVDFLSNNYFLTSPSFFRLPRHQYPRLMLKRLKMWNIFLKQSIQRQQNNHQLTER